MQKQNSKKHGFTLAEILITQNHKGEKSMVKERTAGKGFTLAEILITLTVIGVVAALTIPTLLQNTNQAELKTALKRDFADLSQATEMIKNDNGGTLVNAFKNGAGDTLDSENLKNAFKGKLSYIKECSGTSYFGGTSTNNGVSGEGCWHAANVSQYLNGDKIGLNGSPGLILSNGTLIFFYSTKSDCSDARGDFYRCGFINFDVNGFKTPNTMGKDIFIVSITNNELIPTGARNFHEPSSYCNLSNTMGINFGDGCTAKYLYE